MKSCERCNKQLKHGEDNVTEVVYCHRCSGLFCFECWGIQRREEEEQDLKKILNDFWLLDRDDYENLVSMLNQEIYEIETTILQERPDDDEEKAGRDELVLLRTKLEYIISNELYKKGKGKEKENEMYSPCF